MKFIQTFWTRNTAETDMLSISAGWLSPEYHWMSWALSCLQLKKLFGNIELITDTKGRDILTETLKLPYTNVSTSLDGSMDHYPETLWALAKMHSYKTQGEPFLHFDSDFFLWTKPGDEILGARLVAQNIEKDLAFYKNTLHELSKCLQNIPEPCQPQHYEHKNIYACNAGIIGGNDPDFFKEYCQFAFDFVNTNPGCFEFENAANVNFVIEQYFFYWLANKKKIPITFLVNRVQEDPMYGSYVDFNNLPFTKLVHPVGGHKKSIEVCDHVAKQLRMEYPDHYYLVLDTLKRRKTLARIKIFYSNHQINHGVNVFFADRRKTFQRTIAALEYVASHIPAIKESMVTGIERIQTGEVDETLKEYLENIPIHYPLKNYIPELYELEYKKWQLYSELFTTSKKMSFLYKKESANYKYLQHAFAGSPDEILRIEVRQNKNLVLADATQNWTCKIPELTGQMIKDKFEATDTIETTFALVPKRARMEIDEYYLEPIDRILVDLCNRKKNIGSLVKKMELYFKKKELQHNYSAFQNLIINTIKRLLYLEILVPENKLKDHA